MEKSAHLIIVTDCGGSDQGRYEIAAQRCFFPHRVGLIFFIIFVAVNILLAVGEIVFRLVFPKKEAPRFSPRARPQPPPSSVEKYDDIEDAQFREEK